MKLGFIGCGVMANAMMGGIIKNGLFKPEDIWGADPMEAGRQKTKEKNGINVTGDNLEVLANCDIVFFAIKPQYYASMIEEIKDHVREDQLFISIGAGRTLDYLADAFDHKPIKIVRVMPNTPAQIGLGMAATCRSTCIRECSKRFRDSDDRISVTASDRAPLRRHDIVTIMSIEKSRSGEYHVL